MIEKLGCGVLWYGNQDVSDGAPKLLEVVQPEIRIQGKVWDWVYPD